MDWKAEGDGEVGLGLANSTVVVLGVHLPSAVVVGVRAQS